MRLSLIRWIRRSLPGAKARVTRPGPYHPARTVTDYSRLGFLVRCAASPDGPFRGDESRGCADNLFRASRRIHDIAGAMAGRGHRWPDAIMPPRPRSWRRRSATGTRGDSAQLVPGTPL